MEQREDESVIEAKLRRSEIYFPAFFFSFLWKFKMGEMAGIAQKSWVQSLEEELR